MRYFILRGVLVVCLLCIKVSGGVGDGDLSVADITIPHQDTQRFEFVSTSQGPLWLSFNARIELKSGEAWGTHALRMTLNGREIDESCPPLNKPIDTPVYPVRDMSTRTTPFWDAAAGRWFLRFDSDFIPFNDTPPSVFALTALFRNTNFGFLHRELKSLYYTYIFDVTKLARPGTNVLELSAQLPLELKDLRVRVQDLKVCSPPDPVLFSRHWMEGVFPWSAPAPDEWVNQLALSTAVGQYGQRVFSIRSRSAHPALEVKVESHQLPSECFDLWIVQDTKVQATSKSFAQWQPGVPVYHRRQVVVPELLMPLERPVDLSQEQTISFWVRLRPHPAAVAGSYDAKIAITSAGKPVASLPLRVTILPFSLPTLDQLPISYGLFTMCQFPMPYDDTQKARLKDIVDHGVDSIMMSQNLSPIQITMVDGKIQTNFDRLAKDIAFLQALGINRRYIHFGGLGPIYSRLRELTGKELGDAVYDAAFVELVRQIAAQAVEKRWPFYLVLHDEPNFREKMWKETLSYLKLINQVPEARSWLDLTEAASAAHLYRSSLFKPTDIAATHVSDAYGMPAQDQLKGFFVEPITAQWARDHLFWEYTGTNASPSFDRNRFKTGYLAWRTNLQTFWAFAWWWGNLYDPARKVQERYYLTYPFTSEGGRLCSTIGWESFREGVDDYRYLHRLRQALESKYDRQHADREIRELLQSMPWRLNEAGAYFEVNGYDALRQTIAARITEVLR